MDKLEVIFNLQKKLNDFLIEKRNLNFTQEEWLQKQTLAMVSELAELLDEARFKWWKTPAPIEPAKVKEELVDILHFFISMCLSAGMTADELYSIYLSKNEENFKRQFGISIEKDYR